MVIALTQPKTDSPLQQELDWFFSNARARKRRSLIEFSEQEIIIPDGPFEGRRFKISRQPYVKLLMDSMFGDYWRAVITGPSQSGKTLCAFVIPTIYMLFELGETVICGLPNMEMASDKWFEDLLPAIERTKYRELLPRSGAGSKGGKVDTLRMTHGVTLKFMSGGGGDKSRSAFTSRNLVITETDGMDAMGKSSDEADKIEQLEARLRAYLGLGYRIVMECTVTTDQGRTWREYQSGTKSVIACPCPHCKKHVAPEREHLMGWQEAQTVLEARDNASFACPECGGLIDDEQRKAMNENAMLLHDGQAVKRGKVTGNAPRTDTLGFRWSAFNNLFVPAADLSADEFKAQSDPDEDNAERKMCQFVWAKPYEPPEFRAPQLDASAIKNRAGIAKTRKGIVPAGIKALTLGIDVGLHLCYWSLKASWEDGTSRVVDYDCINVATGNADEELAILNALRSFRDEIIKVGWMRSDGSTVIPDQIWIDAGYKTRAVKVFCSESNGKLPATQHRYRPIMGVGEDQQRTGAYRKPRKTGSQIKHIGEGYHVVLQNDGAYLVEINVDYWKTRLHDSLISKEDQPGAMTLFHGSNTNEHASFTKHLTAEKKITEFVAGKGMTTYWKRIRRANHWLDSTVYATAAADLCGVKLIANAIQEVIKQQAQPKRLTTPDGRPYFVGDRR